MFRPVIPLQRKTLSSRLYQTTSVLSVPRPGFNPKDWKLVEGSPGGVDLLFVHRKTDERTWYTPEGMSAEEILAIPRAKKYWSTVEEVEKYIKEMAEEKARNSKKAKDEV
ncbi:hypothetical protein CVT26_007181 [Gymnopilus dilepis]|uniref:Uncharacterized protein n=1 Tax=Gymnopilus dilepis TaxID=231916 RepID=A0A409W093_9AGAR|nr:hypothetical protein CVT26_007181 [Gymnopilus dilepis]